MKADRTAFTVVEMVIVVVIMGILAAIIILQFYDASEEARAKSILADANEASTVIVNEQGNSHYLVTVKYAEDTGRKPVTYPPVKKRFFDPNALAFAGEGFVCVEDPKDPDTTVWTRTEASGLSLGDPGPWVPLDHLP